MPTLNEVLNELAQTFQTTVSEVQLEGYQVALGDCTEEELTRAAGTWIRSERWMPRPADLRGLVVLDRSQRNEGFFHRILDKQYENIGKSELICP